LQGLVIKSTGSWITVQTEQGTAVNCRIRGTFRLKDIDATNPIAVGDHVVFDKPEGSETGLITEIKARKNYIIRKSVKLSKQVQILAANIDLAILIVTPELPKTSTGFIDRFLATAEAYSIETVLLFNKTDIFQKELAGMQEELMSIYEPVGYQCLKISAITGFNIDKLIDLMKNKVSLFAGHSGVGKSTIIKAIEPGLEIKIGEISEYHLKGMHTTTFAEMFPLSFGGFIIDTPGIREFGMAEFKKEEISHYFPEMLKILNDCQFNNCLHINEPNCAVKAAVERGEIHPMRYYNYLGMVENQDIFR
jgi:ribosome biogenesis GTPase / thiamine phosphate phosphatase